MREPSLSPPDPDMSDYWKGEWEKAVEAFDKATPSDDRFSRSVHEDEEGRSITWSWGEPSDDDFAEGSVSGLDLDSVIEELEKHHSDADKIEELTFADL